jgi:hypothetical protein
MCLFALPSLLLSAVGLLPAVIAPLKVTLSIYYQVIAKST